jgi:hypothetical protein
LASGAVMNAYEQNLLLCHDLFPPPIFSHQIAIPFKCFFKSFL